MVGHFGSWLTSTAHKDTRRGKWRLQACCQVASSSHQQLELQSPVLVDAELELSILSKSSGRRGRIAWPPMSPWHGNSAHKHQDMSSRHPCHTVSRHARERCVLLTSPGSDRRIEMKAASVHTPRTLNTRVRTGINMRPLACPSRPLVLQIRVVRRRARRAERSR